MVTVQVENIKKYLAALLHPTVLSLLSGKETEVKPNMFVKLDGGVGDFSPKLVDGGLQLTFNVAPQVRVVKWFSFRGKLKGLLITTENITLQMDGLPNVLLEAVS